MLVIIATDNSHSPKTLTFVNPDDAKRQARQWFDDGYEDIKVLRVDDAIDARTADAAVKMGGGTFFWAPPPIPKPFRTPEDYGL